MWKTLATNTTNNLTNDTLLPIEQTILSQSTSDFPTIITDEAKLYACKKDYEKAIEFMALSNARDDVSMKQAIDLFSQVIQTIQNYLVEQEQLQRLDKLPKEWLQIYYFTRKLYIEYYYKPYAKTISLSNNSQTSEQTMEQTELFQRLYPIALENLELMEELTLQEAIMIKMTCDIAYYLHDYWTFQRLLYAYKSAFSSFFQRYLDDCQHRLMIHPMNSSLQPPETLGLTRETSDSLIEIKNSILLPSKNSLQDAIELLAMFVECYATQQTNEHKGKHDDLWLETYLIQSQKMLKNKNKFQNLEDNINRSNTYDLTQDTMEQEDVEEGNQSQPQELHFLEQSSGHIPSDRIPSDQILVGHTSLEQAEPFIQPQSQQLSSELEEPDKQISNTTTIENERRSRRQSSRNKENILSSTTYSYHETIPSNNSNNLSNNMIPIDSQENEENQLIEEHLVSHLQILQGLFDGQIHTNNSHNSNINLSFEEYIQENLVKFQQHQLCATTTPQTTPETSVETDNNLPSEPLTTTLTTTTTTSLLLSSSHEPLLDLETTLLSLISEMYQWLFTSYSENPQISSQQHWLHTHQSQLSQYLIVILSYLFQCKTLFTNQTNLTNTNNTVETNPQDTNPRETIDNLINLPLFSSILLLSWSHLLSLHPGIALYESIDRIFSILFDQILFSNHHIIHIPSLQSMLWITFLELLVNTMYSSNQRSDIPEANEVNTLLPCDTNNSNKINTKKTKKISSKTPSNTSSKPKNHTNNKHSKNKHAKNITEESLLTSSDSLLISSAQSLSKDILLLIDIDQMFHCMIKYWLELFQCLQTPDFFLNHINNISITSSSLLSEKQPTPSSTSTATTLSIATQYQWLLRGWWSFLYWLLYMYQGLSMSTNQSVDDSFGLFACYLNPTFYTSIEQTINESFVLFFQHSQVIYQHELILFLQQSQYCIPHIVYYTQNIHQMDIQQMLFFQLHMLIQQLTQSNLSSSISSSLSSAVTSSTTQQSILSSEKLLTMINEFTISQLQYLLNNISTQLPHLTPRKQSINMSKLSIDQKEEESKLLYQIYPLQLFVLLRQALLSQNNNSNNNDNNNSIAVQAYATLWKKYYQTLFTFPFFELLDQHSSTSSQQQHQQTSQYEKNSSNSSQNDLTNKIIHMLTSVHATDIGPLVQSWIMILEILLEQLEYMLIVINYQDNTHQNNQQNNKQMEELKKEFLQYFSISSIFTLIHGCCSFCQQSFSSYVIIQQQTKQQSSKELFIEENLLQKQQLFFESFVRGNGFICIEQLLTKLFQLYDNVNVINDMNGCFTSINTQQTNITQEITQETSKEIFPKQILSIFFYFLQQFIELSPLHTTLLEENLLPRETDPSVNAASSSSLSTFYPFLAFIHLFKPFFVYISTHPSLFSTFSLQESFLLSQLCLHFLQNMLLFPIQQWIELLETSDNQSQHTIETLLYFPITFLTNSSYHNTQALSLEQQFKGILSCIYYYYHYQRFLKKYQNKRISGSDGVDSSAMLPNAWVTSMVTSQLLLPCLQCLQEYLMQQYDLLQKKSKEKDINKMIGNVLLEEMIHILGIWFANLSQFPYENNEQILYEIVYQPIDQSTSLSLDNNSPQILSVEIKYMYYYCHLIANKRFSNKTSLRNYFQWMINRLSVHEMSSSTTSSPSLASSINSTSKPVGDKGKNHAIMNQFLGFLSPSSLPLQTIALTLHNSPLELPENILTLLQSNASSHTKIELTNEDILSNIYYDLIQLGLPSLTTLQTNITTNIHKKKDKKNNSEANEHEEDDEDTSQHSSNDEEEEEEELLPSIALVYEMLHNMVGSLSSLPQTVTPIVTPSLTPAEIYTQTIETYPYLQYITQDEKLFNMKHYRLFLYAWKDICQHVRRVSSWEIIYERLQLLYYTLSDLLHELCVYGEMTKEWLEIHKTNYLQAKKNQQKHNKSNNTNVNEINYLDFSYPFSSSSFQTFLSQCQQSHPSQLPIDQFNPWILHPYHWFVHYIPYVETFYSYLETNQCLEPWYQDSYSEITFLQQVISRTNSSSSQLNENHRYVFPNGEEYIKSILLLDRCKDILTLQLHRMYSIYVNIYISSKEIFPNHSMVTLLFQPQSNVLDTLLTQETQRINGENKGENRGEIGEFEDEYEEEGEDSLLGIPIPQPHVIIPQITPSQSLENNKQFQQYVKKHFPFHFLSPSSSNTNTNTSTSSSLFLQTHSSREEDEETDASSMEFYRMTEYYAIFCQLSYSDLQLHLQQQPNYNIMNTNNVWQFHKLTSYLHNILLLFQDHYLQTNVFGMFSIGKYWYLLFQDSQNMFCLFQQSNMLRTYRRMIVLMTTNQRITYEQMNTWQVGDYLDAILNILIELYQFLYRYIVQDMKLVSNKQMYSKKIHNMSLYLIYSMAFKLSFPLLQLLSDQNQSEENDESEKQSMGLCWQLLWKKYQQSTLSSLSENLFGGNNNNPTTFSSSFSSSFPSNNTADGTNPSVNVSTQKNKDLLHKRIQQLHEMINTSVPSLELYTQDTTTYPSLYLSYEQYCLWMIVLTSINGLKQCLKRDSYHYKAQYRLSDIYFQIIHSKILLNQSILFSFPCFQEIFELKPSQEISSSQEILSYQCSFQYLYKLFDKKRPQIIAMWTIDNPIESWDILAARTSIFDGLRRKYTKRYCQLLTLLHDQDNYLNLTSNVLQCKRFTSSINYMLYTIIEEYANLFIQWIETTFIPSIPVWESIQHTLHWNHLLFKDTLRYLIAYFSGYSTSFNPINPLNNPLNIVNSLPLETISSNNSTNTKNALFQLIKKYEQVFKIYELLQKHRFPILCSHIEYVLRYILSMFQHTSHLYQQLQLCLTFLTEKHPDFLLDLPIIPLANQEYLKQIYNFYEENQQMLSSIGSNKDLIYFLTSLYQQYHMNMNNNGNGNNNGNNNSSGLIGSSNLNHKRSRQSNKTTSSASSTSTISTTSSVVPSSVSSVATASTSLMVTSEVISDSNNINNTNINEEKLSQQSQQQNEEDKEEDNEEEGNAMKRLRHEESFSQNMIY